MQHYKVSEAATVGVRCVRWGLGFATMKGFVHGLYQVEKWKKCKAWKLTLTQLVCALRRLGHTAYVVGHDQR
jgi:hypothetical protein